MMYHFWKTKGMLPSVFNKLPYGELLILTAFYEEELKEPQKHYCPFMGGG